MSERGPPARGETVRESIRQVLRAGPASAHALSELVGVREKDVADHLEHIARSAARRGERLVVVPATCVSCGFEFRDRSRLTRPGACPSCRSTRIDPPAFRLEVAG